MPQLQDAVDQPREQLAPLSTPLNPNTPPPSAAAVLGNDLQKATSTASDLYVQHKQQMDAAQVAARQTVMIQQADDLYNDKDKGFVTTKGLDARDAYPTFMGSLAKKLQAQVASADNPAQQRALSQYASTMLVQYQRQAHEHIFGQEEAFQANAYQERIKAGIDQFVNATNPAMRVHALSSLRGFAVNESYRQGDKEDTAGRWVEIQKTAASALIRKYISKGDWANADRLLKSSGDLLAEPSTTAKKPGHAKGGNNAGQQ